MGTLKSGRLILAVALAMLVYGMITSMPGTLLRSLSTRFELNPERSASVALAQALGLIEIALVRLPSAAGFEQIEVFMFSLGLGGGTLVHLVTSMPCATRRAHVPRIGNRSDSGANFFSAGRFGSRYTVPNQAENAYKIP